MDQKRRHQLANAGSPNGLSPHGHQYNPSLHPATAVSGPGPVFVGGASSVQSISPHCDTPSPVRGKPRAARSSSSSSSVEVGLPGLREMFLPPSDRNNPPSLRKLGRPSFDRINSPHPRKSGRFSSDHIKSPSPRKSGRLSSNHSNSPSPSRSGRQSSDQIDAPFPRRSGYLASDPINSRRLRESGHPMSSRVHPLPLREREFQHPTSDRIGSPPSGLFPRGSPSFTSSDSSDDAHPEPQLDPDVPFRRISPLSISGPSSGY